ncbi:MAG TPA: hypothetical protein VGP89_03385, partial [Candidatus Angelobacter sp.]|nr:hypothetical protein [Candidatus Angelobacter sp.]
MTTTIAFHPHWQELLHTYFLRRQNETFQWGTMDCCLFACDALRELTDVDLATDFRGQYDSLLSAVRVMKKFVDKETSDQEIHLVELVAEKIAAIHGIE